MSLFLNLCVIMFTELCHSNINNLLLFFIACRVKNYIFTPPPSHPNRIKCPNFFYMIPRRVVPVEKRKTYRGLVGTRKVKGHFEDLRVDGRMVLINKLTLWCAFDLSNSG